MERPGDPRRANASHPIEPRLSRLLLAARDLCDGKALPPIQEFLARMTDARRMHFSRTALPATAVGKSKSSMSAAPRGTWLGAFLSIIIIRIDAAPTGVRLFCQFCLPRKCARIALHLGLHALDARDRLGP